MLAQRKYELIERDAEQNEKGKAEHAEEEGDVAQRSERQELHH